MTWEVNIPDKVEYGTYFLRTNVKKLDEETTWNYYNLIREIECSNRQLKPTSASGPYTTRLTIGQTHTFS